METLVSWLESPWPWYVAGPIIGLMVPLMVWIGNRSFGISSNLRHLCAISQPKSISVEFFQYNWREQNWSLVFAIITGMIGVQVMKRFTGRASLEGTPMEIPRKESGRYKFVLGGLIFGLGWGIIGLCPGPIFALVGMGSVGALIALAGALHGTWLYGALRNCLPE
jgi:uncharacterized membrane protein YedE/YeeE